MPESEYQKKYALTCFHDGECPICNIEIDVMKRLDKQKNIKWVDISKEQAMLNHAGLSYEQAMKKMYVLDQHNNVMLSGVDGFLQIWKKLPYYRQLAVIIERLPFLVPILKIFYRIFARYRLVLTGKTKRST
ncbi:MAG: DUF393 domain-containing protein [Gammaproteobacteria bacterium]|nr:DUF393 domain-containing protein [Gammaproteobacteria bacterium]